MTNEAYETWKEAAPVKTKASDLQVGGDHYKSFSIQPSEFIFRNNLNWCVGNAIKYLCRYEEKGGDQDLVKARHYIDLLCEWRYGVK